MVLATLLLTPWGWPCLRNEQSVLTRREWLFLGLASVALMVHFATWITSLSYTTVASSVILVSTNPIYVALASHYILKETVSRHKVAAIGVAWVGSAIVGLGDVRLSGQALIGDLLALAGAIAASAYILLGRVLRRKLSTLAYIWPCYGLAGMLFLVLNAIAGNPLMGHAPQTYLVFLGLALVPQILGHSSFNWALAHFSPILVTLAILGEPIGASILALIVFGEAPPITAPLGGILIIVGIYLASREEFAAT